MAFFLIGIYSTKKCMYFVNIFLLFSRFMPSPQHPMFKMDDDNTRYIIQSVSGSKVGRRFPATIFMFLIKSESLKYLPVRK